MCVASATQANHSLGGISRTEGNAYANWDSHYLERTCGSLCVKAVLQCAVRKGNSATCTKRCVRPANWNRGSATNSGN